MAKYSLYTSKEIKPQGWTLDQLKIQAQGLAGQLDRVWPDVRDSMWIGGAREGWERVPYWLDGFIPLAYLLDDEDMKARAKRYVDKIIESQKADGWICPNGDTPIEKYDNWAIILISKTLTVYYDCSADERVPAVVYRVLKNFYDLLSTGRIHLFAWGEHRWFETFIALDRLREWFGEEKWMGELARILLEQGTDYEKLTELWKRPLNKWTQDTHIVNIMMMLKEEAVTCDLLGKKYTDKAERLRKILRRYNGMPTETFTGDECLAGLSPIHGVELCAVVEQMYSYEHLYAYTGNKKWAERLEKVAFNALPATISDDMWSHQYDQMSNQIECTPFRGNAPFTTNKQQANVFGLEPEYGCCTSNFGQGWPKLVIASFMKARDGVVSAVPIPCVLTTEWRGVPVKVSLRTDYPFRNSFTYTVEAQEKTPMKLRIRIPSFANNVRLGGAPVDKRDMIVINGFEAGTTEITLSYDTEPRVVARPYGLNSVEYGSLVFALPIESEAKIVEYTKQNVERKFPYCDYHIKGTSDWNVALTESRFEVEERPMPSVPFSSKEPAIVLKTRLCHIDWGYAPYYDTVCAKAPHSRVALDEPAVRELYPYGCAKLRMTELPFAKKIK